jgi:hypothetical protein
VLKIKKNINTPSIPTSGLMNIKLKFSIVPAAPIKYKFGSFILLSMLVGSPRINAYFVTATSINYIYKVA